MKKYASQFNELIVLAAEKEKGKKKGGSMTAVLKLVQDLAEFESNIQEAIDAQEIADNRVKIEGFLTDIDKMYEVLLEMAKASIQAMRTERSRPVESVEQMDEAPAPATKAPEQSQTSFTADDLRKQLESNPSSPVSITVPRPPRG
jgi:hypothetical protein